MLHKFLRRKFLFSGFFAVLFIVSFYGFQALAATSKPIASVKVSTLDPGIVGCGPFDANCYIKAVTKVAIVAKNQIVSKVSSVVSTVSDSTLLSALKTLLSNPDIANQLRGPKGDAGKDGISITSSTTNPVMYLPVGVTYANPAANFSGGAYANIANLSSNLFTSNISNITNLTVSGPSVFNSTVTIGGTTIAASGALTGTSLSLSGPLSFTGTDHAGIRINNLTTAQRDLLTPASGMTIFNTTVTKMQVYNGSSWKNVGNPEIGAEVTSGTSGSVLYVDSSGNLGQDNGNLFYDATNHRLGLGDTTPAATLSVGSGHLFQVAGATGNVTLAGTNPVIDLTSASTLNVNTTTNRPVTFGTGTVTIPNLAVNNSQSSSGTMSITSSATTGTIFQVTGTSLTTGTAIGKTITANAGNGQVSKGDILTLTDSTTAGGGFTGIGITVTGSGVGSGSKYLLDLNPNTANNEVVFDNTGAFRPTTAVSSNTATIGSPSFYWKNGYFDQITANNIAGVVTGGATSSTSWTVGSTQAGDVNEAVIFQRNSGSGNATLQWNAGASDLRYLTANYPVNTTYTVTDSSIGTGINLLSGNLTNNTTSGTQKLLSLTNTGTGTTANGIYINNTGTATTGLEIAGT